MKTFYKPSEAISWAKNKLYDHGYVVKTERWQGIPSPSDMWETLNTSFQLFIPDNLEELQKEVKPNLPWADDHFEERVSGIPLNPPPSNEWWPFNNKKNQQFKKDEIFSHTYPERMWPKRATPQGTEYNKEGHNLMGVRYMYGDFGDVINLLESEPFTRQAFLPIWFPEDTGAVHKERVPCFISGTLIQTSTGYREIEKIEIGEFVITHKGRFRKVQEKFISKYRDEIVKMKTLGTNIPIETTKDHPFLVIRNLGYLPSHKNFGWNEEWVKAEDIKKGDYLVHSFLDEIVPTEYSPDLMRLFGYYLSEGEILFDKRYGEKKPKSVRFNMSKKDRALGYIDDLIRIIKKETGKDVKIKESNRKDDKQNLRIYVHCVKFSKKIYEIFGSGSYDKIIPDVILKADPQLQYQLLIGYTRGDGSFEVDKKNIECTSVSKSIIMGLRTICFRNKINNSLQKIPLRNPYYNKRLGRIVKPNYPYYKLVFSQGGRLAKDFFDIKTTYNSRKIYKEGYIKDNRCLFKVDKKELIENRETDVFNIQVEEDNTYNIVNCTVHNCTIGYHFMRRGDHLHVVYYIRSCDYLRHFRDDVYMACRKVLWILERLKERDPQNWENVKPGSLAMHITSLHVFYPEKGVLKQANK